MRFLRPVLLSLIVFFVLGPLSLMAQAGDAERRHPRPRQHREYERREHRQYRPYRPHYRYHRPYRHYRSPQYGHTCRVWVGGYWAHDYRYEWWVPAHYVYVRCR